MISRRFGYIKMRTHLTALPKIVTSYSFSYIFYLLLILSGTFTFCLVTSGLVLSGAAHAERLILLSTKEQQLMALNEMLEVIEHQYGGLEIKQELFGLSLAKLKEKYTKLINEAITVDEFIKATPRIERKVLTPQEARYLLVAVASEFNDGHFSLLSRHSGATITGIQTVAVSGRLYVSNINREKIQIVHEVQSPQPQDEITHIDGRKIDSHRDRNLHYVNNGTIEARIDEAIERIVEVPTAFMPPIPHKSDLVKITFRRGQRTFTNIYRWLEVDAIELTRAISPSKANSNGVIYQRDAPLVFGVKGQVRSIFYEGLMNLGNLEILDVGDMVNFYRTATLKSQGAQLSISTITNRTQVPFTSEESDTIIRAMAENGSVDRIQAYVIQGSVAVLRIPSYSPPGGMAEIYKEITFIKQAIAYFKSVEGIDVLIIDQLANPGGSTAYAHLLLSLLSPSGASMRGLQGRLVLSETLMNMYLQMFNLRDEPQADTSLRTEESLGQKNKLRREMFEELWRQFESGAKLSSPVAFGLDQSIDLNKLHDSIVGDSEGWGGKKIIVLVDERSASAGELVSKILQNNNGANDPQANANGLPRIIVIGAKTMGLGMPLNGHVGGLSFSEMDMNCPFAVCTINGEYIENIGVIPDVERVATVDDWGKGFTPFSLDVLGAAQLFLKGETVESIQAAIDQNHDNLLVVAQNNQLNNLVAKLKSNLTVLNTKAQGIDLHSNEEAGHLNSYTNDLLQIYKEFFDGLLFLENENLVSPSDWVKLKVPLPQSLVGDDPLLRKSSRKDVLLIRLKEMEELPRYKQNESGLKFIRFLYAEINKIQGHFSFGSFCAEILSK